MLFSGANSSSKKNERYPDPLFAPTHCPADRHCLWNCHCHPENSGRHPGPEHRFWTHATPSIHAWQHVHGNLPVSVPHHLPGRLLHSLLSPHIVNLFAS